MTNTSPNVKRLRSDLRERCKHGDVLALLAVAEIARRRVKHQRAQGITDANEPPQAVGHVLRSLKHPQEVETLRKVYGERFVLIGVLLPREKRIARLSEQIAQSRGSEEASDGRVRALQVAAVDESEDRNLGQQMRDTFALADVYVDMSDDGEPRRELDRFFNALFGDPFVSPTRSEYAMSQAFAAGLRSVDLSVKLVLRSRQTTPRCWRSAVTKSQNSAAARIGKATSQTAEISPRGRSEC